MPAAHLFGRRWHFSTDVIPLPASLAFLYHFGWATVLLVGAAATDEWFGSNRPCTEGVHYAIMFTIFFATFTVAAVIDALLFYHGVKGAPFEESKRKWVVPLLYVGTIPLVVQFAATLYGTWVCTALEPDCWQKSSQNAVTNFAQALVFINWAFCFLAFVGVLIFFNMFPKMHQEETWERRCDCIAAVFCCRQQMHRKPAVGQQPPLKNIAQLTAGLLSHVDLDASDIAAAVVLTSAAQQRRRRLRIAKALLPVYNALRNGQVGSGGGGGGGGPFVSDPGAVVNSEEEDVEDDDDDSDEAVGEEEERWKDDCWIPNNKKLNHELSERRASSAAAAAAAGTNIRHHHTATIAAANTTTSTSSSFEEHNNAPAPATPLPPSQSSSNSNDGNLEKIEADGNTMNSNNITPQSRIVTVIAVENGDDEVDSERTGVKRKVAEANEVAAGEASAGEALDQLADAIQEEVEQLDEGHIDEAVLSIKQQESLDLSSLPPLNPENPSIWFKTPSKLENELSPVAESNIEDENDDSGGSKSVPPTSSSSSVDHLAEKEKQEKGRRLSIDSQEAAAAIAAAVKQARRTALARSSSSTTWSTLEIRSSHHDHQKESSPTTTTTAITTATTSAAAGDPPTSSSSSSPPPQTSTPEEEKEEATLRSAFAEQADADPFINSNTNRLSTSSTTSTATEHTQQNDGTTTAATATITLQHQITLQYPTVITPSEHVQHFAGPLPPEALAEIYAGRHEVVPAETLHCVHSFLRYAYAVYSLQPSMEQTSTSFLDFACFKSPDPQAQVFKALNALGEMVADESVEILHLNCSNRVLAHLPYLIALDHAEHAVVIAVRGTIGVADLVTDAVVYPEQINDWLPPEVAAKVGQGEPALAHAGMVSAARAVFTDMQERGILEELVVDAEEGSRESTAAAMDNIRHVGGGSDHRKTATAANYGNEGDDDQLERCHFGKTAETSLHNKQASSSRSSSGSGHRVGHLMRKKVQEDGWKMVVVGHSLGAGAAALISLKLRQYFHNLQCIAYSCPGALMSKNLSRAMAPFCTTVAVGKDAVPRATVATMARLMDELISSLARCKQPKVRVLFLPWWRRHKQKFKDLFYCYTEIPKEAAAVLVQYYESRRQLGQPVGMFPPGKVIFLRPIKIKFSREWDAVWIAPEDLIGEGILVSRTMLKDHLCSTASEALQKAIERQESVENGGNMGEMEGMKPEFWGELLNWSGRAVRSPWNVVQGAVGRTQGVGENRARARQQLREGSLQQELLYAR